MVWILWLSWFTTYLVSPPTTLFQCFPTELPNEGPLHVVDHDPGVGDHDLTSRGHVDTHHILIYNKLEMFYLNSILNFGILPVLVFQLEVYYKEDRLLTGLTAQPKKNNSSMVFK